MDKLLDLGQQFLLYTKFVKHYTKFISKKTSSKYIGDYVTRVWIDDPNLFLQMKLTMDMAHICNNTDILIKFIQIEGTPWPEAVKYDPKSLEYWKPKHDLYLTYVDNVDNIKTPIEITNMFGPITRSWSIWPEFSSVSIGAMYDDIPEVFPMMHPDISPETPMTEAQIFEFYGITKKEILALRYNQKSFEPLYPTDEYYEDLFDSWAVGIEKYFPGTLVKKGRWHYLASIEDYPSIKIKIQYGLWVLQKRQRDWLWDHLDLHCISSPSLMNTNWSFSTRLNDRNNVARWSERIQYMNYKQVVNEIISKMQQMYGSMLIETASSIDIF